MNLRNLSKMTSANDGQRPLYESILAPEVVVALKDWVSQVSEAVLVGGLAYSFYEKPRSTQDVDVLFLSEADLPNDVTGFKKIRAHAFVHLATHVVIVVLTPEYLRIPSQLVQRVFATAARIDGALVASPSALVALKLQSLRPVDKADIVHLIMGHQIDISNFCLTQDQVAKFIAFQAEAAEEMKRQPLGD